MEHWPDSFCCAFMRHRLQAQAFCFRSGMFVKPSIVGLLAALTLLYSCSQQQTLTPPSVATPSLQLPATQKGDQIIRRSGYTVSFSSTFIQPRWSAYTLRGYQLEGAGVPRADQFVPDPLAQPYSATNEDYNASGYDRGHLAPAEDMSWSAQSMEESFYYSNISPQVPAFNRGVWKRLEELVRYWATVYDSVYVVTGPVLQPGLPVIGPHRVAVPQQFYKAVLVYNNKGRQAVGFVLNNEASTATLKSFAVPVVAVEQLTGLQFFAALPANAAGVKQTFNERDWPWTRKRE